MIELRAVYKSLAGKPILSNVSCFIGRGELVGITGPVGAGKSTLLHILTGLISADKGTVSLFGNLISSAGHDFRNRINYASSNQLLSGYATVMENLITFGLLYGIELPTNKIHILWRFFGLPDILRDTKVYRLSSGENSVVNLIKSLLNDPDVLFLDEICAHTDPGLSKKIHSVLKKRVRDKKSTVYISQNIEELHRLCTRIITIKNGRIYSDVQN